MEDKSAITEEMKNAITEDEFFAFESLRESGEINMMEICHAADMIDLPVVTYETILYNYSELKKKFKGQLK